MKKRFNITGTCIPERHYMVNIENKLKAIMAMIKDGNYFTINRPRQYGKTTTMFMLEKILYRKKSFAVIRISFEGYGDMVFREESKFINSFIKQIKKEFVYQKNDGIIGFINNYPPCTDYIDLSEFITELVRKENKETVLIIDEVDKSSNNQLFLSFLGMLRDKYLLRNEGKDTTFLSVILTGVHDVKNLKLKLHPGEEQKLNSPWNIAVDFNVDLSFNPIEIATMLSDYSKSEKVEMDIGEISRQIFYYTSGYPFLVSYLCKIFAEEILPEKMKGKPSEIANSKWEKSDTENAVQIILGKQNTNFESLITNIENNRNIYKLVYEIIIDGKRIIYNPHNPLLDLAKIYGIIIQSGELIKINNFIYQQIIYNYLISKIEISFSIDSYSFRDEMIEGQELNLEKVLLKFQEFMKEQYSPKDKIFIERNGRLIFLAFLKPIINGHGYDFKEVQISEEKRLDVVITFYNKKYIVELKIWRGEKYHQKGLNQLCDYLEQQNQNKGYLVVFDNIGQKQWKQETIIVNNKEIFSVWV